MRKSPRRRFENFFIAGLIGSDLATCALSLMLSYTLRVSYSPSWLGPLGHPLLHYVRPLPVVLAIWFVVFALTGMYEPRRTLTSFTARSADFRAVSLAVLMIAAASFLAHQHYSRAILLEFWAVSLGLTWLVRGLLGRYREKALKSGHMLSRTLIVGTGELGRIVLSRLQDYRFGLLPVGLIATESETPAAIDNVPVLGALEDIPRLIQEHEIDEVLCADPDVPSASLMRVMSVSEAAEVEFLLIAGPLQALTAATELTGPADLPVLEMRPRAFGPVQQALKRACDMLGACILLVLLAPLMLIIALLIRLQTRESALFCQRRVGYKGREFTMYKFRTMRSDTDPYAPAPCTPQDARITPIGRWLRRYSLDELPQLFNVLKGDMSLVGPRPEMPFLVAQYEPWQRRRLEAMPGLTGLWQILGRKDLPLRENLEYDFYYIRNQSLLLDLSILLRTIPVVLSGKGAY